MAHEGVAPWSDWQPLGLSSLQWIKPAGAFGSLGDAFYLPDSIDPDAIKKPTFTNLTLPTSGYFAQIPIPSSVVGRQPANLADWTGANTDPMGDGSRRVALLIENVLVGIVDGAPAFDLVYFGLLAQFRGFGAVEDSLDTEDDPIATAVQAPGATAFPDMGFPGDAPDGTNVAVSFGDVGVARIRHLIEVPNTVADGDVVEIAVRADVANPEVGVGQVQFYGARYRWVTPPFDQDSNTGVQLDGDGISDYADQSRLDELVYEP